MDGDFKMAGKRAFQKKTRLGEEEICKECRHFVDHEDDMDQGWCRIGNCVVGKFEPCFMIVMEDVIKRNV
jgi:hypothetical protein